MADQERNLYRRLETLDFSEHQHQDLSDALSAISRRTSLDTVDSIRVLEMDSTGRLSNRCFLSSTAFRQLCSILAYGSRQTLLDVSGAHRSQEQDAKEFSFSTAVGMFNTLLALRAARLEGRVTLVRDTQKHLIDGILGPQSLFLENEEIYDQATDAVRANKTPVKFHSAVVTGRRMVLRYRTEEPVAVLPGVRTEKFFGGFHFTNNAITGESIRAGVFVLRENNETAACGGFSSVGTVRHTGKSFKRNLSRMFKTAVQRFDRLEQTTSMLQALKRTPLGFTDEQHQHEARIEFFVRLMHRSQLPKSVCRKIVATALHFGSDKYQDNIPEIFSNAEVRSRTMYDLYNAATRVAQDLPIQLQEATEQLAYKLLTGRVTF